MQILNKLIEFPKKLRFNGNNLIQLKIKFIFFDKFDILHKKY